MDLVDEQLRNSKTIAVVGLSDNPERDSHRVSKYMQSQGYRIIPVNPAITEALGEPSYPDLRSVPEPIDMVDIFRKSELVAPVVEQAIEVGVKYIWMQDGVFNAEAAAKAEAAGIPVVMDNCVLRQHRHRFGGKGVAQRGSPPYDTEAAGII